MRRLGGGVLVCALMVVPTTATGQPSSHAERLTPPSQRAARPYVGDGRKLHVVKINRKKPRTVRTRRLPDEITGIEVSGGGNFSYVSYGSWTGPARYGVRIYALSQPRKPRRIAKARTSPQPR